VRKLKLGNLLSVMCAQLLAVLILASQGLVGYEPPVVRSPSGKPELDSSSNSVGPARFPTKAAASAQAPGLSAEPSPTAEPVSGTAEPAAVAEPAPFAEPISP
jgi:hypothetical protein